MGRRVAGLCRYGPRTVELSVHFVERNSEEAVRDTLPHETAHAFVRPGHGHGAAWKAMCLRVGAKPERLSFGAVRPVGRWRAVCQADDRGDTSGRPQHPRFRIGLLTH
jgi:predicted SprT family Zn-dependent metalloprotease